MYGNNDHVCAVIVTYFPDRKFEQRLEKISRQVKHVLVIDNGTTGSASLHLGLYVKDYPDVKLIKNSTNFGVAQALNQGVRKAAEHGYQWVALFDQDSLPGPDMIRKMLNLWDQYPEPDRLMIVGSNTVYRNCSSINDVSKNQKPWEEVSHVITSGSLICMKAFDMAGYFNKDLFIDYVDIEFCLRLRSKGYSTLLARDAVLHHNMGNIEEHNIFKRRVHPTHHNPVRRYYQFRNSFLLNKLYKKEFRSWHRVNSIVLLKIICLILLFEKNRPEKMFQIVKGTLHGLSGRAGKKGEKSFASIDRKRK
ncbi:MAG: glycosyltransferase family 2 protein [Desulfobacterales bacterium]|jgi:rhamnosyltransferase|nr:glycosyltransferase family 2 protein [Desulfobacterales bacterium]MDP6806636.1 glycosyltransferase family 2 protein [Desulfobacterales bacterium]|tara:strand:+ start:24391 stop:25311 length:921 start_codon:yes stop_codon:yes gene_type:complete